ncbi:hypothetical protein HAL07_10890 [Helicobacter ailurogastricus]|uniref:Uncharacterized protein n=1 Tax=Helicobacter ailurogastricus TaxID=1578720 RepID=A0A0K2Y447_9HELI|nr:hypothetical protein HAL07_10890 [Helicobacter ailurogastricus]
MLKSGGLGIECNRDAKEARALRDSLVEQAKINYKGILTNLLKQRLAVICGVLS